MPLNDYMLSKSDLLVAQFQENAVRGGKFRITLRGGESVEGVPNALQGAPAAFTLRKVGGEVLRIPFADLEEVEPLELDDSRLMRLAIAESKKCVAEKGKTKPVPKVGAVLAVNGRLLGSAYRNELVPGDKGDEGDHAEKTLLLKKLKDSELAVGATLYTTLEPCCTGRSVSERPCTEHIIQHGIRRVVIGTLDPNQEICGKGVLRLREAGIDVSLCEPELMKQIEVINKEFSWAQRGLKAAVATGVMAAAQPGQHATTPSPAKASTSTSNIGMNADNLSSYVRAEFSSTVVYRQSKILAVQARLWTIQQLPRPLRIHAWRLIHVRIDGQEVKASERFNERVLTLANHGKLDLQEEIEFSLSTTMVKREQVTISAQLQLEIVDSVPPPAVLPVEERYCRICP